MVWKWYRLYRWGYSTPMSEYKDSFDEAKKIKFTNFSFPIREALLVEFPYEHLKKALDRRVPKCSH